MYKARYLFLTRECIVGQVTVASDLFEQFVNNINFFSYFLICLIKIVSTTNYSILTTNMFRNKLCSHEDAK